MDYAAEKGIPVFQTAAKPWSTDENLYHISFEAGILEDPAVTPPVDMWKLTVDPEKASNVSEQIVKNHVVCRLSFNKLLITTAYFVSVGDSFQKWNPRPSGKSE